MNFIPLRQATATAMSTIATATDEDRLLFSNWAYEAIKVIGANSSWITECRIECKDNSLKKPDGLYKTLDIALYNSQDQEIPYIYHPDAPGRIHVSRFSTNDPVVMDSYVGRVDLSDDAFYFNIGDPANQVSYAYIRYFAIPTDGSGELLIPDVYTQAIMLYCRWLWAMRKNDNRSEIDQNYSMWLRECDRIRAKMKMPTGPEAAAIAASWLTIFGVKKIKPLF